MYPMIKLIPPKKNLHFFSCHCQIFFPFLESIQVSVVHYIINEISWKHVCRNLWDLFPPHSIFTLLEKEASVHLSHCLGLSRYFCRLDYGQVPCANLPQLPDHADLPLHLVPHHHHFAHPGCLYLHLLQLLCVCSCLAATHHHCCHYCCHCPHHWSWMEFPGLFCRLSYSFLYLIKVIIIETQIADNLHKNVYFKWLVHITVIH